MRPACTSSSTGTGALTSGVSASTNSAQALTSGSRYIYRDWVSQVTVKKLKLIARQYKLGEAILQTGLTDRPHLPLSTYMAFSKAIIQGGVSLPLLPSLRLYFSILM